MTVSVAERPLGVRSTTLRGLRPKPPGGNGLDRVRGRSLLLRLLQFAAALLFTGMAVAVTWLLLESDTHPSFILIFAAILVSAWIGGRQPAWLALAVGTIGFVSLMANALDPATLRGETHIAQLAAFFITSLILVEALSRMRRANYEMREHSHRLTLAQQAANIWFWDIDLKSGRIRWSKDTARENSEIANDPKFESYVQSRIHPQDRENVQQQLRMAVEKHAPYNVEYRVIDEDQKLRWIASRGKVFMDRSANPTSVIGMSTDITEQKRAEENRVRSDILLDSIAEGVVYLNASGELVYLNPAAEQMLGYSNQALYGRSVRQLIPGKYPGHQEPGYDSCPILAVIKNGQPFRADDDSFVREDGTLLNVEYTSAPLTFNGARMGAVITFRDIGERKRTEQVLRSSEKLAVTGRISATISHEINNSLESVSNLIFLVQQSKSLQEEERGYLETAAQELGRMAQIVKQTLGFNRESPTAIAVSPAELIDGILLLYERKLHANKIHVVRLFDYQGEVRAFPGELRQVFSNLVVNAADAMNEGGTLQIRVSASRDWKNQERKGVRITVQDSGSGIPPETKVRLFQPFFTTKGEKGTGIGLWVSQGIIEKHHGTIRVHSNVRPGRSYTTFSVFIPASNVVTIGHRKGDSQGRVA